MNIVVAKPPNFAQIIAAFPGAARPGVIFCYGDSIFNPSGTAISPSLVVHEHIHSMQQGDTPDLWWGTYISVPWFRLQEEIAAHRAEYHHFNTSGASRHARRAYLSEAAHRLASPLYGSMITASRAKEIIAAKEFVPVNN